jgi:uncharacterized membrane protein
MVQRIRRQRFVAYGRVWLAALLLVAWGVSETAAQTSAPYMDPIQLPSSGFSHTEANGTDDAGRIVGTGFTDVGSPLLWMSATATPTVLPMGGFSSLAAKDINNIGQIIGANFSLSPSRPVFWASATANPILLPIGGFTVSISADGINDDGQIVGSGFSQGVAFPLFWASPSANPNLLPTGEFSSVSALGINNMGQIVGSGFLPGTTFATALFWASPTASPGRLGVTGQAHGINDDGQIVGAALFHTRIPIFLESPTSNQMNLPDGGLGSGGFTAVVAMDINNDGVIVGWGADFPLLWTPCERCRVTITSFTATPTQGQLPIVNVPVAFAVTVVDPTEVQSVEWNFGSGFVDQTTTTLTTQFTYTTARTFDAIACVIGMAGGKACAGTTVTVQSASQAIDTAKSLVQQLPLNRGQKNSLTSKLNDAQDLITKGNITGACSKLSDVVSQINALVSSGQLSSASAALVLDEVRVIQVSLGCR